MFYALSIVMFIAYVVLGVFIVRHLFFSKKLGWVVPIVCLVIVACSYIYSSADYERVYEVEGTLVSYNENARYYKPRRTAGYYRTDYKVKVKCTDKTYWGTSKEVYNEAVSIGKDTDVVAVIGVKGFSRKVISLSVK